MVTFSSIMSVKKRYVFSLNEEDLSKAVQELNEPENNNERLKRIDDLRNAYAGQNSKQKLQDNSDEFLLRFLRARKFDHNKALEMLKNYHCQQESWPEVFDKVKNPSLIEHVFDAGCLVLLNEKAVDGSAVFIGRPGKVENALFTDFAAAVTISMNQVLKEERNQIYGVTIVEDMSYLNFGMMQQVGPFVAKRFVNLLQGCLPIRVKRLNVVNESKIFDMMFAFIRPFMKEKMRNRIVNHGSNFDLLHQTIKPSALPPKYGGNGEDLDGVLSEMWKKAVFNDEHLDTFL